MRDRAHPPWSVNPLLLWKIVAAATLTGWPRRSGCWGSWRCGWTARGKAAPGVRLGSAAPGLLIGVAIGLKVEYALLGLAVASACRRSLRALAAAAAGFVV